MKRHLLSACAVGVLAFAHCATAQSTLKDAYKDSFLIGAAINQRQFTGEDKRGVPIILSQFNCITPENVLKWESVHPKTNEYNFAPADHYVEFGEKHGMTIIGHTL